MTDVDRDSELVGEVLKLDFPHKWAMSIAAAGIGCNEELLRLGVSFLVN